MDDEQILDQDAAPWDAPGTPRSVSLRWSVALLWGICGTVAAVLLWAHHCRVAVVVHGQAILIPRGEVVRVRTTLAGEVTDLRVKAGQAVERGQLLLRIDSRQSRADASALARARERLRQAERRVTVWLPAQEARYRSERVASQGAATQLEGLQHALARSLELKRRVAANELTARRTQAIATLTNARLEAELAVTRRGQAVRQLARLEDLARRGVVSAQQVETARVAVETATNQLTQRRTEASQAAVQVEALAQQHQRRADERELEALAAQRELQEIRIRLARQQAQVSALARRQAEERAAIEAEQRSAQAAVTALAAEAGGALKDGVLEVRAPEGGRITRLGVRRRGAVVTAGTVLVEIAPADTPLVAQVTVANRDIGEIREGMQVQLRYRAFRQSRHGVALAYVDSVPLDAVADEQGNAVYLLTVRLEAQAIEVAGRKRPLTSGLQADAQFVTRHERLLSLVTRSASGLSESARTVNR